MWSVRLHRSQSTYFRYKQFTWVMITHLNSPTLSVQIICRKNFFGTNFCGWVIPKLYLWQTETIQFYDDLSLLVRNIPKQNILLICWDFNAIVISYQNKSNRNWDMLLDFSTEDNLTILNSKFQKGNELWTFEYANGQKAPLDYKLLNREWINSCTNC